MASARWVAAAATAGLLCFYSRHVSIGLGISSARWQAARISRMARRAVPTGRMGSAFHHVAAQYDTLTEDASSLWEDSSVPDWIKLEKGMVVETFGLKNESFNGLCGVIVGDKKGGRFPVLLTTKSRQFKTRIQPFNLKILDEQLMDLGLGANAFYERNATLKEIASRSTAHVTTIAGNGSAGYADGAASSSMFALPHGLAFDDKGNLLIADTYNDCIRFLTPDGVLSTIAGDPTQEPGLADGSGTEARFAFPLSLLRHPSGDFLITDAKNKALRRMRVEMTDGANPVGHVSSVAFLATSNKEREQWQGPLSGQIMGVAMSEEGAVFVSDMQTDVILTVGQSEVKSTIEASPDKSGLALLSFSGEGISGDRDGDFEYARFGNPEGILFDDKTESILVADYHSHRIRRVDMEGSVTTAAGIAIEEVVGSRGYADGKASIARFTHPHCLAYDPWGKLIIAEDFRIREISPDGIVGTIAGEGFTTEKARDGPALLARFKQLYGLAVAPNGDLAVSDTFNNKIRFVRRHLDENGKYNPP